MAQWDNPNNEDNPPPRDEISPDPQKAVFRFIISQRWWNNDKIVDELGLTDEQIELLNKIYLEYNKTVIQLKADVQEKRFEVDYMLQQDDIDVEEIEAAVDALMEAMIILEKYEIMTRVRILDILTLEQREKLIDMVRKMLRERLKDNRKDG